jgi:zinc transport system substrate-binding protein
MRRFWLGGVLVLCAAAGSAAAAPLPVFVSIPPQAVFVEAVGGSRVAVTVMVPSGANHETYEPTPRQLQALSQAKLYFRTGLPFEAVWLRKALDTNPGLRVMDTRMNVPLLTGDGRSAGTPVTDDLAGILPDVDPHIWLDPKRVKLQVRTILAALQSADPTHQSEYIQNANAFLTRLSRFDAELMRILNRPRHLQFLTYHPAWGYFAQAYGLKQIAIERDGKEPGPRSLAELIDQARKLGLTVVLAQTRSSDTTAQRVAQAIGGRVVAVDALPADYFGTLREVAKLLAEQ